MMRRFIIYIVFVFIISPWQSVSAQPELTKPVSPAKRTPMTIDPDFNDRLTVARRLINQRNYQGASALLENLYKDNPKNEVIFNLLRTCYNELNFWPKMEELSRRFADHYPTDYRYRYILGESLARQDKKDESLKAFKEAISLTGRNKESSISSILDRMMVLNFDNDLMQIIDSLRANGYDSTAFAWYSGKIHEKKGEYSQAALDYFSLLDKDDITARRAERGLHSLLDFEESSKEVEDAILSQTRTDINVRAYRLLSSYFLNKNKPDKAFYFVIKQDSVESYKGISLLNYMRACQEQKLYDETIRMGEYIQSHHTDKPFLPDSYFIFAEALKALGRVDEALLLYDSIIVKFPGTRSESEALYMIGKTHVDYFNDLNRGLVYFDSVVNYYRKGISYLNAMIAIPHTQLKMGDITNADGNFKNLSRRKLNEDLAEEVKYNLALIQFFEKNYDSAKTGFQKLIVEHPRGYFVNDALGLLIIMDEVQTEPELLNNYSEALFFEIRRLPDSAISKLNKPEHERYQ